MKPFLKRILSVTAFAILFVAGCGSRPDAMKTGDATVVRKIINSMLTLHVSQNAFTDEISSRTLENLISTLDPWKLYFYKADIDALKKNSTQLDDFTAADDYAFLFQLFGKFRERFNERMAALDATVKANHDFTVEEFMSLDREKSSYASTPEEMNERWRQYIKYQLLNYTNTGKSLDDAREKLLKRYVTVKKETESYNNEKIYAMYLNAVGMALDSHTNYMTPAEYQDFSISMELKLSGIGAVLRSDDGFVYVESIIPGGPVSRMQETDAVKVNDKIIAVAQGDAAPEDIIDVPLRDAVSRIRGKKGTTVKLTIVRKDPKTKAERTIIIPVVRDDVVLEDSAIKHAVYEQKTGKKKHTIGYIKFPTFYASFKNGQRFCSKDLFDAIKSLKASGVDSIVVDLRGNPGGALTEAIRTAGFFIKSGPVVQVKYSENVDIHRDTDPAVYWDGPLVVLIDKLSASASEIFAGAIRDYNRGLIIGPSKTFGKGTVQDLRDLGGNGAIKVTIQLFYQPSGTSNNMNGIEPNIYIPDIIQLYDYDESKMKYPLSWKPIPRADFKAYNSEYLSPFIVSTLDRATRARRRNDPEFKALEEKIEKYRKQVETKQVSLKKNSDGTGDYEDEIEKRGESGEKDKSVFNLDKDLFLKEAFRITGDYVDALKK